RSSDQRFPQDTKNNFKLASAWTGELMPSASFAAGIVGLTGNGPAAGVIGLLAGMLGAVKFVLDDVANDPPDYNYGQIAQPAPYPLPTVPGHGRHGCIQNLVTHFAQIWGIATATHTAYNRMLGAIDYGDGYWTQRQGKAMLHYGAQLENLATRAGI